MDDLSNDDIEISCKEADDKMKRLYNIVENNILNEENMKFIHDNNMDLLFLSKIINIWNFYWNMELVL